MLTTLDVVKRTTEFFAKHGIESARLNAELIVAHALGLGRMQIYLQFERPLTDAQLEATRPLVRRRAQREPLAYVLGTAAFGDLTLKVDKRALIPRPETEQLVELVKAAPAAPPATVLDLGTGSGALAFALARLYPGARVVATDASEDALALARENAALTGLAARVEFRASDWFGALTADERFDVIVANPPYLSADDLATAVPEVRDHEPRRALVADENGCADLLKIIAAAPRHLAPGGYLFLETGIDQHARLLPALTAAGLVDATSHDDWSGRNRFVSARATGTMSTNR
jgi:release factor glutamine methyltransferase